MNPNTGRSSIFAIVGAYLIYLAYGILKDMIDRVPTSMPPFVQVLVIVSFTGIGIVLLVFAWKVWKKGREDNDRDPVDIGEQADTATSGKNEDGE